jgi:hypothetical protein
MKKLFIVLLFSLFALTAHAGTGKFLADSVLDAALAEIATGNQWHFVTQLPTTYAEATSTYSRANVTVTAGAGNGDYTLANGDVSGRKVTLAAKTAVTLTGNGTITHMCVVRSANSTLLGCLNLGVDKTIVNYTTETWDSSATKFEIADITQ